MRTKLNALSDEEFAALLDRVVDRGDRLVDPETGLEWPVIRGGAVDIDDDGDDEDDAELDEGDEEDEEAKAQARRDAKFRRSARKAARREMVRELGFGNVGALKEALAKLEAEGSGSAEGESSDGESSEGEPKPSPVQRPAVAGPDPSVVAELRGSVAVELASSGIRPEKVKRATKIVMDDLDPADNPSSDDIADVIDALRDEEAGWFVSGSSNDDAGVASSGRGVPNPDRRGTRRKTSEVPRSTEIFESRKDRHRRFELPTNR